MRCFVAASYAEAIRKSVGSEKGLPKNIIPSGRKTLVQHGALRLAHLTGRNDKWNELFELARIF
jgi:hypothetical protein